jgi:hypothetical protein
MEGRTKTIGAVIGLLTAIVVLMGALTNQGWIPTVIKRPVQAAIPGTQANEHPPDTKTGSSSNGETPGGSKNNGGNYGPDTCVQGYVWREAVQDDHVCVTPETREQAWQDNALADSRRIHK